MIPKHLQNKDLCKIRTITSFLSLSKDKSLWEQQIKNIAFFAKSLTINFNNANYEVQSIRIVTNAFGEYLDTSSLENTIKDMELLQNILKNPSMPNIRIRFAIGEAKTENEIKMIPELINKFGDLSNICVNIEIDELGTVNDKKTKLCANIVKQIGETTPRGEGNFNFTVNYNCKPLIPYFPASYHNSLDDDCFVIGLETPDLLVEALKTIPDEQNHNVKWKKSYKIMSKSLQYHIDNILDIVNNFEHKNKTKFKGIDTSAAPSKNCSSMVDIYKLLNVPYFGASGTIEASSLLTKVFKGIKNCELVGFSGLMLAVIEDTGLAEATKKNLFDIRSLLTYSSVCGIGLDTVPIEGDTSIDKISDIMRDTGAMAFRLNKPLTVRLFPLPNLKAGDITSFQSDDLCNSAVLNIP
jgi:uncharacterized protein (UPF0210 family)